VGPPRAVAHPWMGAAFGPCARNKTSRIWWRTPLREKKGKSIRHGPVASRWRTPVRIGLGPLDPESMPACGTLLVGAGATVMADDWDIRSLHHSRDTH
jgi:hypothetical protein